MAEKHRTVSLQCHLKQHAPPAWWSFQQQSVSSFAPGCSAAPFPGPFALFSHPAALPSQLLYFHPFTFSFHQSSMSPFYCPDFTWTSGRVLPEGDGGVETMESNTPFFPPLEGRIICGDSTLESIWSYIHVVKNMEY